MPRQPAPPMQEAGKPTEGLFTGKAIATGEREVSGSNGWMSLPPSMDFTASVSGEDVSLVDKLVDVATTSTGGLCALDCYRWSSEN